MFFIVIINHRPIRCVFVETLITTIIIKIKFVFIIKTKIKLEKIYGEMSCEMVLIITNNEKKKNNRNNNNNNNNDNNTVNNNDSFWQH